MARLTIYKDNYADSTVVSNRFIDEYMGDANDAQLKVYLYLVRMTNANLATSVSDIADKFNHTEKDIMRALKYWEKKQLLALDYDDNKNLVAIHMCDNNSPSTEGQFMPTMAAPVATNIMPMQGMAVQNMTAQSMAAQGTATERTSFTKPSYSLDQVRAFKENEATAQLLYVVEAYIGRPLTPSEMKSILFITDELRFSEELIDYLIQYCVDRGKKDFKYIEKVAINWAEEGITTSEEAKERASKYDKNTFAIMRQLGKDGIPTSIEMEFINRWTKDYGFTNDIIFEACDRTVLATEAHRFEYAEGILRSWKQKNVQQMADILKIEDMHRQKKTSAKPTSKTVSTNRFNQFQQNDYDFEALEKKLLRN